MKVMQCEMISFFAFVHHSFQKNGMILCVKFSCCRSNDFMSWYFQFFVRCFCLIAFIGAFYYRIFIIAAAAPQQLFRFIFVFLCIFVAILQLHNLYNKD